MPFATVNDVRLYYREEGIAERPALVLSQSIGTDHGMWQPQIPDFIRHFHILRYDTRGHGASEAPAGEYSVEQLGRDALTLLDHLGIQKFAWCGLSMGGGIGQWVALHAPDRITALVLANSSPRFGDVAMWNTRIDAVRRGGMKAIVDLVLQRFFSEKTRRTRDPWVDSIRSVLLGTNPQGYLGCCAALRDFDGTTQLKGISAPALIIVGQHDVSTPWAGNGEILASHIPHAKVVHLPAAHLSNIERPRSFNAAVLDFLLRSGHASSDAGSDARRRVLGDAHVNKAAAGTSDLTRDFQDLITRYAWGEIWTRPLLDDRTRRLLVLALMAALGRWEEFRMHLMAGLEREIEPSDLKEVLLLVAIYAGLPAANTAFQFAQQALAGSTQT